MWVGTALFAQVVGVLAVYATGLKVLVLPLGRTLLVVALVRHDHRHCGDFAACIGHADGDNSCRRCVKRTTLGSCADQ